MKAGLYFVWSIMFLAVGVPMKMMAQTPPVITQQPQNQNVAAGGVASFLVSAAPAPVTYRWLLNNKPIRGETNSTLTIPVTHSRHVGMYVAEVRNAGGVTRSSEAALILAFPTTPQVFMNTAGTLNVIGTDGSEQVYMRPDPNNTSQLQVILTSGSTGAIDIRTFPLSGVLGLDIDLGPGADDLVIGIPLSPQWKVSLDTGTGDGMLIADERGLPVPKRPDGLVDFSQLRSAFAPVIELAETRSNLLAQAEALRAQGQALVLSGFELVPWAHTNLTQVALALSQQATNSLLPGAISLQAEAARLLGVASNFLAQAEQFWPPVSQLGFNADPYINRMLALEAQANQYIDSGAAPTPASQAAVDAIVTEMQAQSVSNKMELDHFRQGIESTYLGQALALQSGITQQIAGAGGRLANVLGSAFEAQANAFAAQATNQLGQGAAELQARAQALNAGATSLQAAAAALEGKAAALEQSFESFFAHVPPRTAGLAKAGITEVNCQPSTIVTLTGAGFVLGTPAADSITMLGAGPSIAFGLADNDWITGTPGFDILVGNDGNDAIYGGAGIDLILGGNGDDCLRGEGDIDFVIGGAGNDEITGDDDIDFLLGGPDQDIIEGNDSYDLILGGTGNDTLIGGKDIDILLGMDGDDLIEGEGGTVINILGQPYEIGNLILGMLGTDTCNGGDGIDLIFGNDGDDTMNGNDNIDVMFGNAGNDIMDGQEGGVLFVISGTPVRFGNLMFGNDDNDTMDAGSDLDLMFGNDGNDLMSSTNGTHNLTPFVNDLFFGNAGNDNISGSRVGTDWIFCGPGDDYAEGDDGDITAFTFVDFIFGEDGNDTLLGGHGNDLVFGLDGDDIIQGGDGLIDLLMGGPGADQISGNDGPDLIFGEGSNDQINGNAGPDLCFGGPGDDIINGNGDPDLLFGNAGSDMINGGPSLDLCFGGDDNDIINGNDGPDFLFGNDGNDTCNGNDGLDFIFGDDGVDVLHGNAGPDFLFGGAKADCVFGDADPDFCFGDDGDDLIEGGDDLDLCFGQQGNDEIHGNDGPDLLFGNEGDDEIYGEDSLDLLFGGDGRDKLTGGPGLDIVFGDNDSDLLMGDAGIDLLYGGDGDDWIYGGSEMDLAFGGQGNDNIYGEGAKDFLLGDDGDDCLDGGGSNDWLFGNDHNDRIWGRDGNDRIFGGSGDDDLDGGSGNDYINGNTGSDDLYGNGGTNILLNGTSQDDGLAGGCTEPPFSQICGRKFKDLNANGAYDGGEPYLLGVTIYLDLNCNGMLDAGEPTSITMADDPSTPKEDETGYCFKNLLPGTYCVREIVPPGSTQSYPLNNVHVVGLGVFAKAMGFDFGNKVCTNTQPLTLLAIIAQCDSNKILLSFSAPLDPATATNPANYSVAPFQSVLSATLVNPQTVCLQTSSNFVAGSFYELEICGLKDRCNNLLVGNNGNCLLLSFKCASSKMIYMVPDNNGNLQIIWDPTQDVLECSTNLFTWTPVIGATSPYTVIPNGGMKYFRVRKL